MLVIGCTGGIGAGKSTVTGLLARNGAQIIDADELARRSLERFGTAYEAVLARFPEMLDQDGNLDRARLAAVVFADPSARRDLEAMVHPIVESEILARLGRWRADPAERPDVVVLDVALLVETNGRARYDLDGVLVIDAPEELALARLTQLRAMGEDDARSRIAAQLPRAARLRAADFVILNIGTLDELEEMTSQAWRWIEDLADAKAKADQ